MNIIINPGTGPVANSNEANAEANILHFITDCSCGSINFTRIPEHDYGEGRYAFLLWHEERCHEVQMPGLPLEQVRFMDNDGQNIWDFPRLYVDGS